MTESLLTIILEHSAQTQMETCLVFLFNKKRHYNLTVTYLLTN